MRDGGFPYQTLLVVICSWKRSHLKGTEISASTQPMSEHEAHESRVYLQITVAWGGLKFGDDEIWLL